MKEQLKQCVEFEKQYAVLRAKVVSEIGKKIKAQPTVAKNIQTNGTCRMFTVKFSELTNWNLSPEFYDMEQQAHIVVRKLNSATDMHSLISHIETMIEKKGVQIGKTTYHLNPKTIEVLKEALV